MPDRGATVIVSWANPTAANLGVRALAEGTAALVAAALGDECAVVYPIFEDEPLRSTLSTRALARGLVTVSGPLIEYIKGHRALVEAGGGDSFTDIYGLARLVRMAHIHRVAHSAGVPVVFGPQTIGPFETRTGRFLARRMLASARVVLARDPVSAEHSIRLGRRPDAVVTDVVFALPPPAARDPRDIVLNVSGLLWASDAHTDSTAYRTSVRGLIEGALAEGRSVTLLPHVLDNPSPDNDVPVSRELEREFGGAVHLHVPESLADARSVLGSASVVVGARMHACLNALSAGVPTFPWAYSRKFLPLMEALGWNRGIDLRNERDPAAVTLDYLRNSDAATESASAGGVRDRALLRLQDATEAMQRALEVSRQ